MNLITQAGSEVAGESGTSHPNQELSIESCVELLNHYQQVRAESGALADPLSAEDMQLQSMPDVSPSKWHLGHTSWFFETFVLRKHLTGYRVFDPDYHHLFNSYYNSLGQPFARPQRGLLSRPDIEQVFAYRRYVDQAIERLLTEEEPPPDVWNLITLGLNHEQQHQELMLTDIKHAFSINPLLPAYQEDLEPDEAPTGQAHPLGWLAVPEDIYTLGSDGDTFHFDNEGPPHQQFIPAFSIASRLVTNAEYLEFMEEGGYLEPRLWLSDGWTWVNQNHRKAPLYWQQREGHWYQFSLAGLVPLNLDAPVCHLSYYEADAFATWAGKRLPTEFEWEVAAWLHRQPDTLSSANLMEKRKFDACIESSGRPQFLGNLWEWTSSAYQPYPGFRASTDAVGEYNGKFMCNQMVLRGGSCATPASHIRISYRNFFYPHQAWQFTGIRLAGDPV
ncbi:ergothioneine biosynthesis protein EgtB [Microbulbifer aggregans]|uniref:ergothioneine biosynthesis protein EgtB n=1 Tax=Microbulbifer aggregans TaxID=1769779 RepID=UPI001CFE93A3|nr:ergothioneine biosynthesis protein EgtB [Microbulbifer aggregans]